jgi:hypothetical protein
MSEALLRKLNRVGPLGVAVIAGLAGLNGIFLVEAIVETWFPGVPGLMKASGFVRGADFMGFWAAAQLAAEGQATLAYDKASVQAIMEALSGFARGDNRFLYPPIKLLFLLPLGTLPYLTALLLWQALPLLGLLLVMASMGLPPLLYWLLPLSAGVTVNLVTGQNGLLSCLFLAGGFLCLGRRPALAGFLLAFMSYKPQLALLLGPALLIGRQWRALGGMVLGFVALAVSTLAAFGPEPWWLFLRNVLFVGDYLEQGHMAWARMPTVLVAAQKLGADPAVARVLQMGVALPVVAAVAWVWVRPGPTPLKAAALVAAMPLISPWSHDYDLAVLLLPIAWLILDDARARLSAGEIAVMILAWALPSWWVPQVSEILGVSPGAPILLAFFLIVLRRALQASR